MKLLLIASLLCFAVTAVADVLRLSEPTHSDTVSETFGAPMDELPAVVLLSDVLQAPETYSDHAVTVNAKVAKVCQKKGCFFIAQQGNHSVRVAFKDYGFFVPTNIDGRQVTLVGQVVVRDVSPKQAEHFTKDLATKDRNSGIKSGRVVEIVASSVRVPLR